MHNLLTGKHVDPSHPINLAADRELVEGPWTTETYLEAVRRNLHAASKPGADTTTLLLAANTLALAAQAAWPGPAAPPARVTPCDGDAL